jgi:acylpyruvate hydrolase
MHLVTFQHGNQERLGALLGGENGATIIDLNRCEPALPTSMTAFLGGGSDARALAEAAIRLAPAEARLALAEVTLRAPVPAPSKIICIGRNYAEHAAEGDAPVPTSPVVFAKYANTVIGPGQAIRLPRISN